MTRDHITIGPSDPCIEREAPLETDDGYCVECRRNDMTGEDGLCDACRPELPMEEPDL